MLEQPFRGPLAGKLVEEDFHPHRHAQTSLGNQLGCLRCRPRSLSGARAGPLISTPLRPPTIEDGFDLDLFGILGPTSYQRQAAVRTAALRFRQFTDRLANRKVAIVPASVTWMPPLLAT